MNKNNIIAIKTETRHSIISSAVVTHASCYVRIQSDQQQTVLTNNLIIVIIFSVPWKEGRWGDHVTLILALEQVDRR